VSIFGAIGSFIMTPLYYLISIVLVGAHKMWSALGLDPSSGLTWALSIVTLTICIRAALIPLFVKQIKASRNMQLLQPQVKELQKKYGHDREKLTQETMKLYKDAGTNPFASCLPILLQMPIFLALFRLLNKASKDQGHGILSDDQATQFAHAKFLGVRISDSFNNAGGNHATQILALTLVIAMLVTTFTTQRQLMSKNMPKSAMEGPYAQQQKILLYVLPLVFAVGGVAFPIGVLIYWTVSNLWTMAQQFYVIRNNPVPGTPAAEAKAKRDAHKAARHGGGVVTTTVVEEQAPEAPAPSRQQPKKQTREQRKKNRPQGEQK
jgi:YidC/Oxa1 family membrane protein insertase